MVKRIYILLILIFITVVGSAQKVKRIELSGSKQKTKKIESIQSNSDRIIIKESLSQIEFTEQQTKKGSYVQLTSDGMGKTFIPGLPDLPVISKLIDIPANRKVKIKVISYDEELIDLKNKDIINQIAPAQASVSKRNDPKDVPFKKDEKVYTSNTFFKRDIIKYDDLGFMRDKHLGYIEISPFEYNPVANTLKVLNNIEIEISFVPDGRAKALNTKSLESPYFKNIVKTINQTTDSKTLISGPVKYVIVSDPMFKETLQPFIEWKTMKGYNVVVAYTDTIGTDKASIKSYLQNLYDNPSDGVSPTFVLFVGDVAQIPAYDTQLPGDYHVTDLYYCEYTGDKLPEVFYGRFSATTVEELQPQIDKTLEVEKYEMPDASYLNNVILVAGVDAIKAPTYGNGFINYANQYYTNNDNGITSLYYLYNNASGVMASDNPSASASIRSNISSGVAMANYTAHCSESGWFDPSFTISNIDALTNEHMYPLIIGNCCQSLKFEDNSFGEAIVRASGKGAVGYIGGSDFTYWDEDYYWGVGVAGISADPTYDNSGLGAYDRFFHLKGESKDEWYVTQGQMIFAGNLAVEASTSELKEYYWEIYHLMGDPSLTPFVTVPEVLTASYNPEIMIGSTTFQVSTEEDAYVAISNNGVLLDAKLADNSGLVNLEFNAITETGTGTLDLVITKQNRQPIIDEIQIVPTTSPYVVLKDFSIDDQAGNNNDTADYAETIAFNIQLQNVSEIFDAFSVEATLTSEDTNIVITQNLQSFGTILKLQDSLINSIFSVNLKNKFVDKQSVPFELVITGKDSEDTSYSWTSKFNIKVNAPELKIGEFIIVDSTYNNDGILDPGENVKFKLEIENNGSAALNNIIGKINSLTCSSLVTINNNTSNEFSLNSGERKYIYFDISLNENEELEVPIEIEFSAFDHVFDEYVVTELKNTTIGKMNTYLMSEKGVHNVYDKGALFYDSGGESNNYSNNEKDTITFYPNNTDRKVIANFISFYLESESSCNYDYISVYDSSVAFSGKLIGKYCGTNSPGKIIATNAEGALTFVFSSDINITEFGWKAELSQTEGVKYVLEFNITDTDNHPIEDVKIDFNSSTLYTNNSGEAVFKDIAPLIGMNYSITKEGYDEVNGTVDIIDQDVIVNKTMMTVNGVINTNSPEIKIYPNPSSGIFNLEITNTESAEITVKIFNVLGSIIYNNKISGIQNIKEQIDISKYAKGIYFLSVESDKSPIVSRRIIIK